MIFSKLKKKYLRYFKNLVILIFLYIKDFFYKRDKKYKINFVTEKANWSIKWDGKYIKSSLKEKLKKEVVLLSNYPSTGISGKKVIHFGSQYMWVDWYKFLPKKNKYIVSFFHGKPSDGYEVKRHIDEFISSKDYLFKVITASSIVKKRLLDWGFSKEKIYQIPIGVDTNLFTPPNDNTKFLIREKLGFKPNEFIVGSFQKDGMGWGQGNIPKYIKGPDLLVQTLELIAKNLPISVLLTGPARGYVKNELSKRNIKFKHIYLDSYLDIVNYYNALDLYIVSSREEGGPKAIVESMARGVPIVSTDVGMARDFITDNLNGGLALNFDPYELAQKSINILINKNKKELIRKARKDVMRADWNNIANLYWDKVYMQANKELTS